MNAKREILSLCPRLLAVLLMVMVWGIGEGVAQRLPAITKHPTPLSINAKRATLMLYTQAMPQDEGALTYQWYRSTVATNQNFDITSDGVADAIRASAVIVSGQDHYTLNEPLPDPFPTTETDKSKVAYYYYWCKVTNTKGGEDCSVDTDICKVMVYNKELADHLRNGGFQEFYDDFDGTTAGSSSSNNAYDKIARSGRPFIAGGVGRYWTSTDNGDYPATGGTYVNQDYVWDDNNKASVAWYDYTGTAHDYGYAVNTYPNAGTTFALPPALGGAYESGVKYWDTTHAFSATGNAGYSNGKTTQLMVATGYGSGQMYLDPQGHNKGYFKDSVGFKPWHSYPYIVELSPDAPSSLYQEIATLSGKIYEWSLDHAPRSGRSGDEAYNNRLAVVIGPAINSPDDYNEMGVTSLWKNTNTSFTISGYTQYKGREYENLIYPYGVNATGTGKTSFFNNIVDRIDTSYGNIAVGDHVVSYLKDLRRKYFVFVGDTDIDLDQNVNKGDVKIYEANWTTHSGVYSVPVGQGITVFSFVGLIPDGASGNLLDNIEFKSGTPTEVKVSMAYSGHVTISMTTRTDYVYGLAEVRGSAVDLLTTTDFATFNGNPIAPKTAAELGAGTGVEHWFFPGEVGKLVFSGMVPGKSYRVVGIPKGAVSGEDKLNTNITPAKVLDAGYYKEVSIPGANTDEEGEDGKVQMPTVGARDNYVFLTNSNKAVKYALVHAEDNEKTEDINEQYQPVNEYCTWRVGQGLDTGLSLFFENLERGTCYILVARPAEWEEVSYESAAQSKGAILICTPPVGVNDIREEQVTRLSGGADGDIIRVRQAIDQEEEGEEHVIDADNNTYSFYDVETGELYANSGKVVTDATGTYVEFKAGTTPAGDPIPPLDKDKIYQIVVKMGQGIYMAGVRVYPYVDPLHIFYEDEIVAYNENRHPLPNKPNEEKLYDREILRYRMRLKDSGTWLLGGEKEFITANNNFINLGGGTPSLLDQMWAAGKDAIIETCYSDLWPESRLPSVYPIFEFEVPRRPAPPRANDCDDPDAYHDYFVDYPDEKITVPDSNTEVLLYSINNGTDYISIGGTPREITFNELNWTDTEKKILLRKPGKDTDLSTGTQGYFASEAKVQSIKARGESPVTPYAQLNYDTTPTTVEIYGLDEPGKSYEYKLQTATGKDAWITVGANATSVTGLDYITLDGGVEVDYEVRYPATCDKPASLPLRLSMPLTILTVEFGNVVYNYSPDTLVQQVEIRNVSTDPVRYSNITQIPATKKNDGSFSQEIFEITQPTTDDGWIVPGTDDGGKNRSVTIKPIAGLSVGTYTTTLTLYFEYNSKPKITTAEVLLNVVKAPAVNTATIRRTGVTDTTLEIEIDNPTNNRYIEYKIDADPYQNNAGLGMGQDVLHEYTGLEPAESYSITYRIAENENYYASNVLEAVFSTAYAMPNEDIISIDYDREVLMLKDGESVGNYVVMVNGNPVDVSGAGYLLTEKDLSAPFTIKVRQIDPKKIVPDSEYREYSNIPGRPAMPTNIATIGDKNNIITVNGGYDYVYRQDGSTGRWSLGASDPLAWGRYQVRYPADAANKVFASKSAIVPILPPLNAPNHELFVNINVEINRPGYKADGSEWIHATPSLSAALEYARTNEANPAKKVNKIHVASGTYSPALEVNYDPNGPQEYTFALPADVQIIGGYNIKAIDGSEIPGISNQPSILLGKVDNETENVYHVISASGASGTTLKNFVIAEGEATGSEAKNQDKGAGLYLTNGSEVKLINVLVRTNVAADKGGGIYIDGTSKVSLVNVTVAGNTAAVDGGGIYNEAEANPVADRVKLEACNTIVYRNVATATTGNNEISTATDDFKPEYCLVRGMNLPDIYKAYAGNLNDPFEATSDLDRSPLFIAPGVNNYHLIYGSIAQDAGLNYLYYNRAGITEDALLNGEKDMAGRWRVGEEGIIDLGAYETQPLYILKDDTGKRLTNNSPMSGGALVRLQSYDLYGVDLEHVHVKIGGVLAPFDNGKRTVDSDGIITVVTGASEEAKKCEIELWHWHDGRLWDTTAPRSFTYFPVEFIEDGKWSEPFRWKGQTGDLIVPGDEYPNPITHIHIKANCRQDVDITAKAQMKEITVHPGKAYTIMDSKTLTADVMTLEEDASFLPNSGTLNVKVQQAKQHLAKDRNWYLSNPMSMTDLGNPGKLAVTNPTTGGKMSPTRVRKYNEATREWDGIVRDKGESTDLTTGLGHIFFSNVTDMNITFSGKYNNGDVAVSTLTKTDGEKSGFNLVGNPFPSYWQWSTGVAEAAGLYSTIWYRTYVDGAYEFWSYNASGNVGVAPSWEEPTPTGSYSLRYVPPMQAFWVRVKSERTPGTLIFANDNRTHADHASNITKSRSATEEKREETEALRPLLRVCVSNDRHIDEALIYADPAAKTEFDDYDSEKWFEHNKPEIFTLPASGSHELVINALPLLRDNTEVPLGFHTDEAGTFNIYAKELLNMDKLEVYLIDKLKEVEFDLRSGSYNFSASSMPDTDRFRIVFRSIDADPANDGLSVYQDGEGNVVITLRLKEEKGKKATVAVIDAAGRKSAEQIITIGEPTILKQSLGRGMYIVQARKYVAKLGRF